MPVNDLLLAGAFAALFKQLDGILAFGSDTMPLSDSHDPLNHTGYILRIKAEPSYPRSFKRTRIARDWGRVPSLDQ